MIRETIACREDGFWRVFRVNRTSDGQQLAPIYRKLTDEEFRRLTIGLPICATTTGTRRLDYASYLSREDFERVRAIFQEGDTGKINELVAKLSLQTPYRSADGVMIYHVKETPPEDICVIQNSAEVQIDLREF